MFTDQKYYDMFEELASKHKEIRHSSGAKKLFKTPEEIDEKNLPKGFMIILLPPHYDYVDLNSDNLIERVHGTFMIIKSVEKENFPLERTTISQARSIGRDFLSRMKKMRMDKIFNEFYIRDSRAEQMGPILENCFGMTFTFTIGDPAGIFFNAENWDE